MELSDFKNKLSQLCDSYDNLMKRHKQLEMDYLQKHYLQVGDRAFDHTRERVFVITRIEILSKLDKKSRKKDLPFSISYMGSPVLPSGRISLRDWYFGFFLTVEKDTDQPYDKMIGVDDFENKITKLRDEYDDLNKLHTKLERQYLKEHIIQVGDTVLQKGYQKLVVVKKINICSFLYDKTNKISVFFEGCEILKSGKISKRMNRFGYCDELSKIDIIHKAVALSENYIKTLDGMMKDSDIDCGKCDRWQDAEIYNPECRYLTKIRCPKCYRGNLYTRGRFALKEQKNEKKLN